MIQIILQKKIKHIYVFKHAQGPSNNHNMKNHRQANNQITGRAGSSSKQGKEESKFYKFLQSSLIKYKVMLEKIRLG